MSAIEQLLMDIAGGSEDMEVAPHLKKRPAASQDEVASHSDVAASPVKKRPAAVGCNLVLGKIAQALIIL